MCVRVLQELQRLQKLMQLPSIPEALKEKFGKFDENLNPTHDHEGKELDSKVSSARVALHFLILFVCLNVRLSQATDSKFAFVDMPQAVAHVQFCLNRMRINISSLHGVYSCVNVVLVRTP